jgi:hypothetical protein
MTGWLTRHSDSLTDDERATRDAVLDRSPALRATGDLVSEFAQILNLRRGHELRAAACRPGAGWSRSRAWSCFDVRPLTALLNPPTPNRHRTKEWPIQN